MRATPTGFVTWAGILATATCGVQPTAEDGQVLGGGAVQIGGKTPMRGEMPWPVGTRGAPTLAGRRGAAAGLVLAAAGWLAPGVAGCAAQPAPPPRSQRELVMAYDDARASGTMAFPNAGYESVVRFELPQGEHQPLRLRFQAEAPGKLEVRIYESTPLETPGDPVRVFTRDIAKEDLSDGRDGRWVVEDLGDMKPLAGVVWIGVHKTGGEPTIWASSVVSGQAFVRNNDPQNSMGLLPTKRTPLLRLEVAP